MKEVICGKLEALNIIGQRKTNKMYFGFIRGQTQIIKDAYE